MATFNVPGLIKRRQSYFWQPSPMLAKHGWTPLQFGRDEQGAIVGSRARNAEVDAWKAAGRPERGPGGITVPILADPRAGITLSQLIRTYKLAGYPRAADEHESIKPASKNNYDFAFDKLIAWAGDKPANHITTQAAREFIKIVVDSKSKASAWLVLAAARRVYAYGIDQPRLGIAANPFQGVKFAKPKPRRQVWDMTRTGDDYELFADAAEKVGRPELALAVDLFLMLGQRTIDMVKVNSDDWKPIYNLDPYQARRLTSNEGPDAGRVMGFHIYCEKVSDWVVIPVGGDKRRRIEAQIARNAARTPILTRRGRQRRTSIVGKQLDAPVKTLLVNEHTGQPWDPNVLRHWFREARAHAVEDMGLAQFAGLQLRDLRRTAVVRMGEAGLDIARICALTGHSLANATRILETYMPRNVQMAAAAVVHMMDHDDRRRRERDQEAKSGLRLVHAT